MDIDRFAGKAGSYDHNPDRVDNVHSIGNAILQAKCQQSSTRHHYRSKLNVEGKNTPVRSNKSRQKLRIMAIASRRIDNPIACFDPLFEKSMRPLNSRGKGSNKSRCHGGATALR